MTQFPEELVESVARALMRTSGMHPSEIEHRISKNTGGWAAWQQSAIVALEASRHTELVEAMRDALAAMILEHDAGQITLATMREARVALAKAKGEAPPNVG